MQALAGGAALLGVAAAAWLVMLRGGSGMMPMHGPAASPSLRDWLLFTWMWRVMTAIVTCLVKVSVHRAPGSLALDAFTIVMAGVQNSALDGQGVLVFCSRLACHHGAPRPPVSRCGAP